MNAINKFYNIFFEKENAEPLGLVRILMGALMLLTFLIDAPHLSDYFSDKGYVPNAEMNYTFRDDRFSVLDYTSSTTVVYGVYILLLIAAFLLTIGYKTRIASIATFILVLSFHERNWLLFTSGDTMLRVMAFYLMIANSGAAYSVDAILRRRKGIKELLVPKWNRLLIKYQVSIFYFFSGFAKAAGRTWVTGTAVYYALANSYFARYNMQWLNNFPVIVNIITYATLFIELSIPFLLWFKETRLIAIFLTIALQGTILVTMNIGTFQLVSMAVVLIFLEKENIDAFFNWLARIRKYFSKTFIKH